MFQHSGDNLIWIQTNLVTYIVTVKVYLSGILNHKGGSVDILSDDGTEFQNKVLNQVCDKLAINWPFANPLNPQGNAKVENTQFP